MSQTIEQRFSLQDKVALVTGASSGLGAHFARTLADAGATVVAAARRKEKLQTLVEEINAAGGQALAVAMDVTSAEVSPRRWTSRNRRLARSMCW